MSELAQEVYAERFDIPSDRIEAVLGRVAILSDGETMSVSTFMAPTGKALHERVAEPFGTVLPYMGRAVAGSVELGEILKEQYPAGTELAMTEDGDVVWPDWQSQIAKMLAARALPGNKVSGKITDLTLEPILPSEIPSRTRSNFATKLTYVPRTPADYEIYLQLSSKLQAPRFGALAEARSAYVMRPYILQTPNTIAKAHAAALERNQDAQPHKANLGLHILGMRTWYS